MLNVDVGQIVVVSVFATATISCVVISVRYVRYYTFKQIRHDIIESAHQMKNDMRSNFEDTTSQANITPPEDVGDGRSF